MKQCWFLSAIWKVLRTSSITVWVLLPPCLFNIIKRFSPDYQMSQWLVSRQVPGLTRHSETRAIACRTLLWIGSMDQAIIIRKMSREHNTRWNHVSFLIFKYLPVLLIPLQGGWLPENENMYEVWSPPFHKSTSYSSTQCESYSYIRT